MWGTAARETRAQALPPSPQGPLVLGSDPSELCPLPSVLRLKGETLHRPHPQLPDGALEAADSEPVSLCPTGVRLGAWLPVLCQTGAGG